MTYIPDEMWREILSFERLPVRHGSVNRQIADITEPDRQQYMLLNRYYRGWNTHPTLAKYQMNRAAIAGRRDPHHWKFFMMMVEYWDDPSVILTAMDIAHKFGRQDIVDMIINRNPDILDTERHIIPPIVRYNLSLRGNDFPFDDIQDVYSQVGYFTPELIDMVRNNPNFLNILAAQAGYDPSSDIVMDIINDNQDSLAVQHPLWSLNEIEMRELVNNFDPDRFMDILSDISNDTAITETFMRDIHQLIPDININHVISRYSNSMLIRAFGQHIDDTDYDAMEFTIPYEDSRTPVKWDSLYYE